VSKRKPAIELRYFVVFLSTVMHIPGQYITLDMTTACHILSSSLRTLVVPFDAAV
jgi:hypothetical protein